MLLSLSTRGRGLYAPHMEYSEVLGKVIGVLTVGLEMNRQLHDGPGAVEATPDGTVEQLLYDTIPRTIAVDPSATPQEVAEAVTQEMLPAINNLTAAFAHAFVRLAEVHDAEGPSTSANEVLRELALEAGDFRDL
jgi:hypothetical protein